MAQAEKVLVYTTHARNIENLESQFGENQFGFKRGVGTTDAITTLRIIKEKQAIKGQGLCMVFIYFKKAFDRVNHQKLFEFVNTRVTVL